MSCPSIGQLPPPPKDRCGWPWAEESPQLADIMPEGNAWPRISIVTPSYNQAQFLEETIRSVLLQGYPNLEYIIIDGGSTDNSVDIIKKYEPWLAYWVSEKDRGQSHAINKGWLRTTGHVTNWINSDDVLLKGALAAVARAFHLNGCVVLFGSAVEIDEASKMIQPLRTYYAGFAELIQYWKTWGKTCWFVQPAVFYPTQLLKQVGLVDDSLHWAMDYDLWLRLGRDFEFSFMNVPLATQRLLPYSKTRSGGDEMWQQTHSVSRRYWGNRSSPRYWRCVLSYYLFRSRVDAKCKYQEVARLLKGLVGAEM